MATLSRTSLIHRLESSRLLNEEQFRRACGLLEQDSDAERGAVRLVGADLITRWQARQLLAAEKPKFFIGQYKLLKELGRGSMGVVYRAFHMTMSRVVAVKVLPQEFLKDARAVARFEREIRTVAVLDHPQIVHALDAGRDKNTYYLVMEHVDGKDLRQWIKAAGPLPIPWSCECIRQAALGLQHAFERGVTHRDIKPSNLLVCGRVMTDEPRIKIVDFGLARVSEDLAGDGKLTRIGRTVGTWEYMAPEQTQDSSSADIRSDLFGLGCTLFQMVTGELPYRGQSDVESLLLRVTADAPRLRQFIPQIDSRIDNVVAKMLARQPANRFQTPVELVAALEALPSLKHLTPAAPTKRRKLPEEVETNNCLENTDPEFSQFLQTTSSMSTIRFSANSADQRQLRADATIRRYAARIMFAILVVAWLLWVMLQ